MEIEEEHESIVCDKDRHQIVIIHDRIAKRREDRYILNFAQCLQSSGYFVTVFTSEVEDSNCINEVKFTGEIDIQKIGWWIPRHFFGMFRTTLSSYRAICMALKLIFKPPIPSPFIVILDTDLIALFAIKLFTKHKVFYIEQFRSLKYFDACCEHMRLSPNLFEAKWIKNADEVIVESQAFVDIFKRSYPITIEPRVLTPLIDYGLWNEPGINIDRIIPDISKSSLTFVTFGKFRKSSNFSLLLDSFEEMLDQTDDIYFRQRAHLIIGGHCKLPDEKQFYDTFLERLKNRWFASQVTVLRQLPTIHQKTLLIEATVVLHTSKNDICSDFLLEAMSLGKPIIAINKGIATKILENRITGVLVEPQTVLFAATMLKVAQSPHIQNFLGEMAKDAFNHKYSFDSFSRKLYNLVQKHSKPIERIMPLQDMNDES